MAYTIVSAPAETNSTYSLHTALWHVVTSSNSGQPDFRFVFDIVIGGVTVARLKVLPDATGQGIVDVSRVVRSRIANYFAPRTDIIYSPFAINTDLIAVEYSVYYGEEYTTGGVTTTYANLAAYSYYAFNAYQNDTPGGIPYQPMVGHIQTWATSRDITQIRIPRYGNAFLSYVNDPTENHRIRVQEIDDDGNNVSGVVTSVSMSALKRLLVLNLNMDYINSADFSPASAPLNPDAAGYKIKIVRADGIDETEWAVVRFLCEPKTPATPLHFLNRFGGFDTFFFSGPTRKEVDIERKTFQRLPMVQNSGGISEYDENTLVYADTTIPFNTRHTWSRKLSSGYVDDNTHEWLWELIASPQVFIEINGFHYPVTIRTQKWSEKLTQFDKMYNLDIEITMGRQVFSQSR